MERKKLLLQSLNLKLKNKISLKNVKNEFFIEDFLLEYKELEDVNEKFKEEIVKNINIKYLFWLSLGLKTKFENKRKLNKIVMNASDFISNGYDFLDNIIFESVEIQKNENFITENQEKIIFNEETEEIYFENDIEHECKNCDEIYSNKILEYEDYPFLKFIFDQFKLIIDDNAKIFNFCKIIKYFYFRNEYQHIILSFLFTNNEYIKNIVDNCNNKNISELLILILNLEIDTDDNNFKYFKHRLIIYKYISIFLTECNDLNMYENLLSIFYDLIDNNERVSDSNYYIEQIILESNFFNKILKNSINFINSKILLFFESIVNYLNKILQVSVCNEEDNSNIMEKNLSNIQLSVKFNSRNSKERDTNVNSPRKWDNINNKSNIDVNNIDINVYDFENDIKNEFSQIITNNISDLKSEYMNNLSSPKPFLNSNGNVVNSFPQIKIYQLKLIRILSNINIIEIKNICYDEKFMIQLILWFEKFPLNNILHKEIFEITQLYLQFLKKNYEEDYYKENIIEILEIFNNIIINNNDSFTFFGYLIKIGRIFTEMLSFPLEELETFKNNFLNDEFIKEEAIIGDILKDDFSDDDYIEVDLKNNFFSNNFLNDNLNEDYKDNNEENDDDNDDFSHKLNLNFLNKNFNKFQNYNTDNNDEYYSSNNKEIDILSEELDDETDLKDISKSISYNSKDNSFEDSDNLEVTNSPVKEKNKTYISAEYWKNNKNEIIIDKELLKKLI